MPDRQTARQRGYTTRWDKARLSFLRTHPLCAECDRHGRITPATVVDHIAPHRGDQRLFWDTANWQALCKHCHDSHKQREEHGTLSPGCGASGLPTDPRHPWAGGLISSVPTSSGPRLTLFLGDGGMRGGG